MQITVSDHPLVAHKLTTLRDRKSDLATFRRMADDIAILLAYEATRHVNMTEVSIETPMASARCARLAEPAPLVVPLLRAGLGLLDGMLRLLSTAEVGVLGMVRDSETLQAKPYAARLPEDLGGRQCFLLDPALGTGGTLAQAIRLLVDRGAADVTAICLLASPVGVARLREEFEDSAVPVRVVVAGLDERLSDEGFIVPGMGDAGDRLFGVSGFSMLDDRIPGEMAMSER
ncbi:uracil phosphoribosyltransferase [Nonomuraea sp. NPDC050691]|uniref:uracil phosphoribosyltransferase n=1 Tax=Nonomuraea sp. NPDC050691 TaxID=3155661 RepID=UPI003405C1EE